MHKYLGAVLAAALVGITGPAAEAATVPEPPPVETTVAETPDLRQPPEYRLNRRLLGKNIKESSGLARSTYRRGVLWTHNDSDDRARIFAVGRRGHTRAVVRMKGADNHDFEDIAAGPGHTLWVGDIGNDRRARNRVQVYRVAEPRRLRGNRATPAKRYDFAFEDGPRNAEALMVHPRTGRLYIVSKLASGAGVYAAPKRLHRDGVNMLRKVADAPGLVTSGKFTPKGRGYYLTNYDSVIGYAGFDAEPVTLGKPPLKLGESLEVTDKGTLLVGTEGPRSPVFAMRTPRLGAGPERPSTPPTEPTPIEKAGSYRLDRTIIDPAIRESSGLALSTYDPSLLWTHNDSGDRPRIFAVNPSGTVRATLVLGGASARDWEDMSAGPGHSLWVGDIGDNAETRTSISVYRIAEPASPKTGTVPATGYTLAYPDGRHNAETLMVNPVTGRVYIVTKATDGGPGAIYAAPATLRTSATNTMVKVGTAPGRITAGAFAPGGNSFMLRTQTRGYLYSSLTGTPREIPLPSVKQGESLTYSTTAARVFLGSEGLSSPVHSMATGVASDPIPEPTDPTPTDPTPTDPTPTDPTPTDPTPTDPTPTDPTPTDPPSTGYGPTARSVPSVAFVTPEQHGAKGDGSTDDTAAFQRALNAAEGKTLWLPAGRTYNIGKTLSVPSNTTVLGAGPSSVVRFTWTGVNSATSGGGSNIRSKGVTARNIHLANFVLEGGGNGLPGGLKATNPEGLVPLLKLIKVDGFSVKNMELRKAEGLSISYTGSTNGVFQRNWVHHSGRDGITGYRNTDGNVTDILVDSNLIEKVGDDAIAINGLVPGHDIPVPSDGSNPLPKRITITNNVIRGWEVAPDGALGRGIALNGVAGVVVENNVLSHPNSTGILLTGCNSHICAGSSTDWPSTNAQLLNNKIMYSTGGSRPGAIAIIKTTSSVVRGNTASYSSPYDFSGCSSCTISGNTQ